MGEPAAQNAGDENAQGGGNAAAPDPAKTGEKGKADPTSTAAAPVTGTATDEAGIDPAMRIEVDVLTYAALGRIAVAIARRCARAMTGRAAKTILLVPPATAAAMMPAELLLRQLEALAGQMELLAPDPDAERREGITLPGAAEVRKTVDALTAAVDQIAKTIGVTVSFAGRTVAVEDAALIAAIGGKLLRHELKPLVTGGAFPLRTPAPSAIARVLAAGARLRGQGSEAAGRLLAQVDATLAPLLAPGGATPAALQLLAAIDANPGAPALVARPLAAGGAYRLRRHLFTLVGLADPLSAAGGAVVQFSLSSAATGELFDADILYDAAQPPWRLPRNSF